MTGQAGDDSDRATGGTEQARRDSGSGATVAERMRGAEASLSPAERKIVRVLSAHYPTAGLESASGLATLAGVSAPTVVRFVARLGFDGYRHDGTERLHAPTFLPPDERIRDVARAMLAGYLAAAELTA